MENLLILISILLFLVGMYLVYKLNRNKKRLANEVRQYTAMENSDSTEFVFKDLISEIPK